MAIQNALPGHLREHAVIVQGEVEKLSDITNWIRALKKTGALTINFNQGGLCKQVEWREKCVDRQAGRA